MRTITVLRVAGCAGGQAALQIAARIAEGRPDVRVEDVIVEDETVALARGFRGSPTVLVDGRDVEEEPRTPVGSMG